MSRSWEAVEKVTLPGNRPVIGPYLGRIIAALAERLIPDGGALPIPVGETRAFEVLAVYLRDQPAAGRRGIKALFIVFDLLPFLFLGRFKRFVNLSPQEQELYLWDWYASRIYFRRMVVVLLKTLTGMGYYNDPEVLKRIGVKLWCEERKVAGSP